jgi:hypothetical protein
MSEVRIATEHGQTGIAAGGQEPAATGRHGAAVVFVRRNASLGIGHVGWGFLVHLGDDEIASLSGDNNIWEIGAVENHSGSPITPPLADGYWNERTSEPLRPVAERGYDHYKVIHVPEIDLGKAFKEESVVRDRPYVAAVSNCMNDVYNILTAYGVGEMPDPSKLENWIPNTWYGHIKAPEYAIDDPSGLERRDQG